MNGKIIKLIKTLPKSDIIPKPDKHLTVGERIKILETSLELYKGAINRCNAADISNLSTKIGVYSSILREELGKTKDDTSLKSMVDLNLIEKNFTNQYNRLIDGQCRCKIKGNFFRSDMVNTVYFDGNGREILELMKMALCGFKDVYVTNAFLHPHHGLADEGRATLDLIVNIPTEKKWVDIHYHHHESEKGGYGNISYIDHYYHLEPFPEDRIKKSKDDKFTWGYSYLTGDYILNDVLERKKCK